MRYINDDNTVTPAPDDSNESRADTTPTPVPAIYPNFARSYQGAKMGNTVADWLTSATSANTELSQSLPKLQARCQDLVRNNPYARNYIMRRAINVVGANGIRLQMRIMNNGEPDELANNLIEKAWKRWGKNGNPTVCGQSSILDVQDLIQKTEDADGEVFIRLYNSKKQIQILESAYVDPTYNAVSVDGNEILMGIEFDEFKKPLAYYVYSNNPGDLYSRTPLTRQMIKVPAEEMIHIFKQHRTGQIRGEPSMVAGMLPLHMITKYDEAEVIAARMAANKSTYIETQLNDTMTYDQTEADGSRIADSQAGDTNYLYRGQKVVMPDPKHPSGNHAAFLQAELRGFASSVNVPYESIGNNRQAVNFSSIRSGRVEEIDSLRVEQRIKIEHLMQPLFEWWLKIELAVGELRMLTYSRRFEYIDAAGWLTRGYAWVDPKKDAEAQILLLGEDLTTKQAITSQLSGEDYVDILAQRAKELKLEQEVLKLKLENKKLENEILGGNDDATGKEDTGQE